MTAIIHALYVVGQIFAIMGVVFVAPLLVCDCCRYCWKRRCARRQLGNHSDVICPGE